MRATKLSYTQEYFQLDCFPSLNLQIQIYYVPRRKNNYNALVLSDFKTIAWTIHFIEHILWSFLK